MVKAFFIPNKQSVLGQQEILTAKSILALVDGLESHSYDAVYLRQPLNRLEYIECGIVGRSQFLFKVRYLDSQKGYQVIIPDLITRADWEIVEALLQALSSKVGEVVEGLADFDLEIISTILSKTIWRIRVLVWASAKEFYHLFTLTRRI